MKGPTINGKQYELVVLRVVEWDASGRPSKAVIGHDDTTFDLSEDPAKNVFLTAFVVADQLQKATKH